MRATKVSEIVMLSTLGLVVAGAGVMAFAAKSHELDEAASLTSAKLTLSDAINYALSEVPGKVLRAELDDEHNPLAYNIEVVQQGKTREVLVDAQTGRVISNVEDKADKQDGDHDD